MGFVTIGEYQWNRPMRVTLPGGTKKEYEYDPLMRVKRITAMDPGQNVFLNYEYTHDKINNIIDKETEHGNYAYGYDDLYRLTTADNPVQDDEAVILSDYVYNTEDRLTEVWNGEVGTGSFMASYYYDPFGRRLWKEVGGVRTVFHYTDEGLIGEYDAVGNEIKAYGYKPGST